ncbi:ThiF family adenylyltransferase [Streptomyces sp. RKAG293]|uniref:ThiF family adenylyltransferase n=1 Tax=Streptomyces sp. RKAG293 TaxID=2893403 RepID=UPI00203449D7|nr:ThiF family adenylyltransferase [Streptomyces sp. RKAG293]MCM2422890.1 ThiF family adenylyltransferase [Streptomyces sp. RKAG293]
MTHPVESGPEPDHFVVPSPREAGESFRPVLLDPALPAGAAALAALRASARLCEVHDRIEDQVAELVRSRAPHDVFGPRDMDRAIALVVDGRPDAYGRWAWYPWSGRLVHVLPEAEFRLVRTDRNRDKITREQQEGLLRRRVGVVGLSVGSSAALTCAMEGVGGAFRLADFDRLSLSNLNRLRAGVHELGLEKSVLCARRMYELDPYLDIEIHRAGVTDETIADFFADGENGRGLDVLIEECDTPWVKVAAREHARRGRIPVLMDTNDRGLLDIERFDLEPDRPLFHGRIGTRTAADVRGLDRDQTIRFLLDIVDEQRLSPAMTDALTRVGQTLSSWPQLASGVMLGAALLTDTARRILLGEPLPSGRHSIDLDALVPVRSTLPAPHGATL